MPVQPNEEEFEALAQDTGRLLDWCDVADPARAALLTALGATTETPVRLIARMPKVVYERIAAAIRIGDELLTPMQASSMALVWETARVVTGIEKSHKQVAKETADTAASDRLVLQAMTQAGAGGGIVAQTGTTLSQRTVAAELTVDQSDRKR